MFLHYYLQKGFALDYLNNLSFVDKQFMVASMAIVLDEEHAKWENLSGLFSH